MKGSALVKPRKDAVEHRARIIAAATAVFARSGCGVALEEVVAAAGVGRGTLYRHFPAREDLVAAVLRGELDRMIAFVDARRAASSLFGEFLQHHAEVGLMAVDAIRTLGPPVAEQVMRPLQSDAATMYQLVVDNALAHRTVPEGFDIAGLMLAMRMVIAAASQAESGDERKALIARGLQIVLRGLG